MTIKLKYALFFVFLLVTEMSTAQESMMQDVSYPFLEKLVTAAKTNYPKNKTFDHRLTIAALDIKKANLDWLNIVSFIYLYSPTGTANTGISNPSVLSGFQAGFSISIGTILQKPGLVKAAKEEYSIAKLNKEEYGLNIEAVVQQRYFQYIQQKTLLNWKSKDLESSETMMNDLKHKFEKGEVTFESYNSARTTYSNSIQSKIQAEGAYLVAKSNLEEIIGVKLESLE